MGGKGGDRKSYKATSSAKAAEALAAKGGAAGFGGFSGVRPVAGFGFGAPAAVTATASGPANGDAPEVSSQLDGDLAQCLRHLSKKDTTTKMKALQSLKDLIPQKSASDLTLLLQPWVFQFKKLLLDPSKLVRAESAAVMAAIASSVGKALLPQLKSVLGPWYLACFDPYPDAAAAAKRSMSEVFSGKKQVDALVYCRSEVMTHISTSFTSTPASLGDVRKDTPEELEERHERIVAASLAAAAALLTTIQQQQTGAEEQDSAATAAAAAVQEVQDKLQEILQTVGFFKKYLGSKSTVIRRAAYGLIAVLSSATPRLLQECQAAAAPSVLGALQEKEPSNHPVMWEMLLSYITSQQPSCWQHINMQKAFIPRLLAFLRHGCYGSAASSLPALLPLLALLPRQQLQGGVLLQQVLEAVWVGGMQQFGPGSAGRAAAAAAYKECMNWGLKNAAVLSGNAAAAAAADAEQQGQQQQEGRQYCEQLLLHGHFSTLLETSLAGSNAEGEAALAVVQDLLLLQCSSSSSNSSTVTSGSGSREIEQSAPSDQLPLQLDVVLAALSAAAQQQLVQSVTDKQQQQGTSSNAATTADSVTVCARLQSLFDSLVDSASSHAQAAASRLAASCCAALLPLLQAGQQLPAAASQLVARLIREYPGAAAAGSSNAGAVAGAIDGSSSSSSSIAALVQMGIRTSSSGEQLSAADCDLLLSCIAGSSDTAAAWGEVFDIVAAVEAAGLAIAAWRFMDALLRRFVITPVPAAAAAGVASAESAEDWSHSGLDALVVHLMKQLAAAAEAGVVISTGPVGEVLQHTPTAAAADVSGQQQQQQHHHHWDLSRSQAAAASLLGCCLGANEQQQVLLGHDALRSVLQHMQKCLAAAYVAVQQQQIDELSEVVAAAATVVIAALHMALESSSHAAGTSSSSMWQQQPNAVVELLLLLAQLSWGDAQELLLPELGAAAAEFSSSDEDDDVSSSSGDDSSSNGSEGGIGDTQQQAVTVTLDSSSSNMPAHLTAVQQAAYRVWNAGLLSSMVGDLAAEAAQQLVQQLQLLLTQGLATAAAAGDNATAAAVMAGLRWGNRAAVVLSALDNQQQQQEVLQQLLTAVTSWQHWSSSSGDSSSTINAHLMMMQFCIVLVLDVGCELLVPLSGHHSDVSTADAESNTGNSSCRQWLLLELLCSVTAAAQDTVHSNSSAHLQGITAAAAATQHHLLRCACRSSNASAAVTAQRVLAGTLSTLLALAGNAAAAENATVAAVHCNALTDLLQQAVALYNAHSSQKASLLSMLQDFAATEVIVAASSYMKTTAAAATAAHGSSSSTYPSWVLAAVIDVLAGAFRFTGDEASVVSSRISDLSLGFINKALAAADSESSSSSSSNEELQDLMQLVVACFPMQSTAQQEHNAHHHATATAAAKGVPVSAGSSTAQERQGLTALLRYVGSSSNAAAAADVQCKLQLCCVAYCWSDMSAAEWHIVLRDSQQRLTAVRRDIERAAGSLAAAACSAAQQLMGSSAGSSDDVITPAMAIEILRRLARKGLLQRQAAVKGQLAAAADQAVSGLSKVSLPGLRLGLLLLAAVQQLQQQIQAAGRAPQLDLALQSAWRELLAMLLALGAAAAVAAASGPSMAAVLLDSLAAEGPTWQLLGSCLGPIESAAVGKALAAADERVEMIGVDSVSSCLALLQLPWTATTAQQQQQRLHSAACQPLQQLAWKLLLHPTSLANVTHAAAAAPGSSGSSDGEEVPEFGVNDDPATYLVQVGFRPEMAAVIAAAEPWQVQLLHWSLLLAHTSHLTAQRSSATSSAASRRLTQALRDVPELVPELLHRVVGIMGLGGSSNSSSGNLAAAHSDESSLHPITSYAGSSAVAQAQLSAKLSALCPASSTASGGWSLSEALASINLPIHHASWRLLSAALYRSVLSLLPASARIWFSDLRDRSRITAVEAYTTKYESPALLAAEFAAIKRDAAGSAGEVGGSCSFRVTASPAAREVTAVLEIEDGATLELQVKLPAAAPLKAAEVECKNKVGIKDGRLRKWLLSIAVFLRNQNQGVLDAISMWKANLEQEFAGVQPCLICYSVISAANGQLPRLSCKQCSVTFHPACLYKWFRSSGKSTCPHCQAPW